MSDNVSRHGRDDGSRHRHRSRSRDRRKRAEDKDSEGSSPPPRQASRSPRSEQSERRRHHRHSHSHKRPRRSLSPGEIAPEKPHHSRHHSHKRKEKHHHDNEIREKSKSPVKLEERVETPKSLESDTSDSEEVFGPMPAPESEYCRWKICVDISQQARSTRPRGRAEFGHDPKDIERYEQMGFVMSGNRKRRKVPQVTDDELRKAGFAVQKEVRDLKEKELVARFKELIETRKRDSTAQR
jgi:NF-kappa-B-activating protein C-terminal domain